MLFEEKKKKVMLINVQNLNLLKNVQHYDSPDISGKNVARGNSPGSDGRTTRVYEY